jgi:N6-adenosine-specific RNA methylase IME4
MTDSPFQVMPPLSADEYEALKADIAARGVMVPVEYDEFGAVLDGHHRLQICEELGISQWPRLIRHGLSDHEKRRHARRLNLDRRHLDTAARRKLIEDDLRDEPEASNRKIASGLGVDHKTVGKTRADLESTGEIPQLDERKGRDQRIRRIVQYVDPTPEGIKGTKLTAKTINEAERTAYRENSRDLAREMSDATALQPGGRKFAVLYADPPWRRKAGFSNRSYENHYPTMIWEDICAVPVKERSLPDAWLFMWIPRAHAFAITTMILESEYGAIEVPCTLAHKIARSWGFDQYSTCFVWTKTDEENPEDHGNGLIVWDQDELLLLFKRGKGLPMPAGDEKVGSNHREKPREHSRKPDFYRDMIRRMIGPGVQVMELFGRFDDENPLPPDWWAVVNGKEIGPELPGHDENPAPPLGHPGVEDGAAINSPAPASVEPAEPGPITPAVGSEGTPVESATLPAERNTGGDHVDATSKEEPTITVQDEAGEVVPTVDPASSNEPPDIELPDNLRRAELTKRELAMLQRIRIEDCDRDEQAWVTSLRKNPDGATALNVIHLRDLAKLQGLTEEQAL